MKQWYALYVFLYSYNDEKYVFWTIFQKSQFVYDARRKDQLIVHFVRMCIEEKALRMSGASLWNNLHKDMVQCRLKEWFRGKLKNITLQITYCDVTKNMRHYLTEIKWHI